MKNCINCGAPIDEHSEKCAYCGTLYYDFCGINIDNKTPVAFRVKYGDEMFVSFLAIPKAGSIEYEEDVAYARDQFGNIVGRFVKSVSARPNIDFEVIPSKGGNLIVVENVVR